MPGGVTAGEQDVRRSAKAGDVVDVVMERDQEAPTVEAAAGAQKGIGEK